MTIRELIAALQERETELGGDAPVTVYIPGTADPKDPSVQCVEAPVHDVHGHHAPNDAGCMLIVEYHWPSWRDRRAERKG